MQTVSGFHGRQVWEYDPDAGTDEERSKVEQLRREFTENRFRRRESQDLLMRMQVRTCVFFFIKNNLIKVSTPFCVRLLLLTHVCKQLTGQKHLLADMRAATKIEDGDEVTEESLQESLRRALGWMSALQAEDGHWPGDYSGIMYIMPFWVRMNIQFLCVSSITSTSASIAQ
jgi:hypothetical protein